jgi:oligo-alginate lyase
LSDFTRIQQTAAEQPWAAHVVEQLIHEADDWPARHVHEYGLSAWALPKEGAGWSHDYVCPIHGVRLRQEAGKNICPVDGKDYHGWPIDNVVYMMRNDDNARAARDLGLAYCLTHKAEYAQKVDRIINAYSDLYPRLPIHDNDNHLDTKRGARVMSQTLSEAKWIVPLVFGYDLVRDAIPANDRSRFESSVLRNAGLEVGDRALVDRAVDGKSGFNFQMRESITPDGPWLEGSWGYHFFALEPLLLTREMAVRAGISVPDAAALKRMFDAPIHCVFPDGTLPNFNDTGLVKLASEAPDYEIGYAIFHDPLYLTVLHDAPRGMNALLWGVPKLPAGDAPILASEVLPNAGMATLRVEGSDHTVALKFGPHGGGHGHFDKLTFISYANGKHLAVDPGTQAYGAKTHTTWDKMTVAHNTVAVDEHRQSAATGKLLEWYPLPHVTAIRASAGPVYTGIEFNRTLVQTGEYMLDLAALRASDGREHRFDWFYHNFGSEASRLELKPYSALPQTDGYQHLTNDVAAETQGPWSATFSQPGSNLQLNMLGQRDTTVVIGQGLGPDLRVPVPFVMARRMARETNYAALYEPYTNAPELIRFEQPSAGHFIVQMPGFTDELTFEPGTFVLLRKKGGAVLRLAMSGSTRNELLESSANFPVEVDWSLDGKNVDVYTNARQAGWVRIVAAQAEIVRLNGKAASSQRDGKFQRISW